MIETDLPLNKTSIVHELFLSYIIFII